jgi:hypothetical protein
MRRHAWALAALLLPACGRDQLEGLGTPDAGLGSDGALFTDDGALGDGALGDGALGDALFTDSGLPPDASFPDGAGPTDALTDDAGAQLIKLMVDPPQVFLQVGQSTAFHATGYFSDGSSSDVTTLVGWSSSDATIATADASGTVTGIGVGMATITAASGGVSATGTAIVASPQVVLTSIAITPPLATLAIGSSQTFIATGTFSDGSTADVSSMATWSGNNAAAVSVAGSTATALTAGSATVTAAIGSLFGTALVTVSPATVVSIQVTPPSATSPANATVTFKATATLSDGTHQDVTQTVAWTTRTPTVATIAGGIANTLAAGQTLVTATFHVPHGGVISGSAVLTVSVAMLVSIQLQPVDPTAGVHTQIPFTATGIYSDGSSADLTTTVRWSSSATNVATISSGGVASTLAPGTTVITAALNGIMASSTVTVTMAPLMSITVTPPLSTLNIGGTVQLVATGTYADGTSADLTTSVTWSSSSPGVASVSNAMGSAGLVTALSAGNTSVVATLSGISGAAKVIVSPATLTGITVTPAMSTIGAGGNVRLLATGTFSDGTMRDITTQVTWSSSNPMVASVSNAAGTAGTVQGLAMGRVTITATLMGQMGTATVVVSGAALTSIDVTPANATTMVGIRSNYTATGHYSDGTTRDLTTQVTWTTADPAVATISNVSGAQGQLLATGAGSTTVRATLNGVSGSTMVTVTGPMLTGLQISPINPSVRAGTMAVQFTAIAIFSNGTQRNVTGMASWSSSDTTVAGINNRGTAMPAGAGTTTIQANYMGLSASTMLTVSMAVPVSLSIAPIDPTILVGAMVAFQVTVIYSDGTSGPANGVTLVSSDNSVLTIQAGRRGPSFGVGVAPGMATVTASYMGLSVSTNVTVSSATLVGLSVSPPVANLELNQTQAFQATAIYSDGTSANVTNRATWQSSDTTVAQITTGGGGGAGRGRATALGPGSTTITATYMGLSGTAMLHVSAAMLTAIQVTPFAPTIPAGTTQQFQAVALYSDGTSTNVTLMATWQSSDATVAGITTGAGGRGLATGIAAGTTMIVASYMGAQGSATLTVSAATISRIQVTPFTPTVPVGYSLAMAATAIYSDNSTLDITRRATWSSSQSAVANVSNGAGTKGVVFGAGGGQTTVSAAYMGATGGTMVTVSPAPLMSIRVTPSGATLNAGQVQPFAAIGNFGTFTFDLTTIATWLSSNTMVADVSNAAGSEGQVTAFAAGGTTISAVHGGMTGTATITVR